MNFNVGCRFPLCLLSPISVAVDTSLPIYEYRTNSFERGIYQIAPNASFMLNISSCHAGDDAAARHVRDVQAIKLRCYIN